MKLSLAQRRTPIKKKSTPTLFADRKSDEDLKSGSIPDLRTTLVITQGYSPEIKPPNLNLPSPLFIKKIKLSASPVNFAKLRSLR